MRVFRNKEGPCRTIKTSRRISDSIGGIARTRSSSSPPRAARWNSSEQRPHVLHGWVAQLRERFGGRPVGLAIEQRRGAVIHALMQYEFLVLYPVNPKALARYREAFHPKALFK